MGDDKAPELPEPAAAEEPEESEDDDLGLRKNDELTDGDAVR